MQALHASPLKGEDLHTVTLSLLWKFSTCNVMQSLATCLTSKGEGFAHGDLQPLVSEFLTCNVMQSLATLA